MKVVHRWHAPASSSRCAAGAGSASRARDIRLSAIVPGSEGDAPIVEAVHEPGACRI
jgi:hypothetical protein